MRFHIQQESDIPASTQPATRSVSLSQRGITHRGIAAQHPPAGDADGTAPQHDQQGVPATETDGVVEATAGSGIYVRDQQKPMRSRRRHIRNRGVTDLDREVRKCVDGLLNAGCTLQQTRELLTREIDWRLRRGARVLVSTLEDIGASMLTPRTEPCLDAGGGTAGRAERSENSSNGTVVTSRYFFNRWRSWPRTQRSGGC